MNRCDGGSRGLWWPMLACAALLFLFMTGAAEGAGSPSPSPSPSPIPQGCQAVSPQPSAPTRLNSVWLGKTGKTIVVDLETFNCYDSKSTLAELKQVQTFIELVDTAQSGHTPGSVAVARSVEGHICTDGLVTGGVSCQTVTVPLGTTTTPLAGCSVVSGTYPFPAIVQPSEPLELGTVSLGGGVVETVSVTKQVFDCQGSIGDLYLFTETSELLTSNGKPPSALGTKYEGVICTKDATTAALRACKLFTPAHASG